ncbi:hypothetical protein JOF57_005083 [Mycolicibacterium lutetiense]|uniref:Uncharacterized protein n=1 Tax=Mycolicibacterium lutetiense TaxID=1641992 RepID=A0ABS5A0F8_9MYCO|nr:hypothetical protein [Mycolicibacterium lutetiense]
MSAQRGAEGGSRIGSVCERIIGSGCVNRACKGVEP